MVAFQLSIDPQRFPDRLDHACCGFAIHSDGGYKEMLLVGASTLITENLRHLCDPELIAFSDTIGLATGRTLRLLILTSIIRHCEHLRYQPSRAA
jgi:hypothetical protein